MLKYGRDIKLYIFEYPFTNLKILHVKENYILIENAISFQSLPFKMLDLIRTDAFICKSVDMHITIMM